MRQLSIRPSKRLRGIPRRLRALRKWSESFHNYFPDSFPDGARYWNWKIPVHESLVQGKFSSEEIRRECAQYLIDACSSLIQAKPLKFAHVKIVARICSLDMFGSEICIYIDKNYYLSHTTQDEYSKQLSSGRKLSEEWWLNIPKDFGERLIAWKYTDDEIGEIYRGEDWFFGEIE